MKTRALLLSLSMIITAAAFTSCGNSAESSTSSASVAEGAGDEYSSAKKDEAAEAGYEEAAGELSEGALEPELAADLDAADIEADEILAMDKTEEDGGEMPVPDEDISDAFILTAGEWNDNDNWGFFSNIVNNQLVEFPQYGLDPTHRIAVKVENSGTPLRNKRVKLLNAEGDVLGSTLTDKNGNAYFYGWNNIGGGDDPELVIEAEGAEPVTFGYSDAIPAQSDDQSLTLSSDYSVTVESAEQTTDHAATEVMFILDTTGSMGDEIMYLQKDFAAIAAETAGDNITYSVNFYRDAGDDYVTKCNPFTSDISEVQSQLNNESASGGGDFPEAVADILEETITYGQWREDSNKIAFLIFDAPPHDGTDEQIAAAIKAAAEKGIHLVPVVASNSERSTELFGRAVSIMTNSNYVFLTDDSGVGESHLEPIIGAYDVELLHDIIVRNINEISS